ncbi:MAG: hypothetical protein HY999_01630 [Nitrospinae bacterium]|nr:hypothetical protein [Nitrospinota bacterium]
MPGEENINLQSLEHYQASLIETELLLKEAKLRRSQIQRQISGEEPLITAFSTQSTSPHSILQARLYRLQEELASMMPEYTERYPDVIRVKREIGEVKDKLIKIEEEDNDNIEETRETDEEITTTLNPVFQDLRRELGKVELEIVSLESRYKESQRKVEEYQNKVKSIPLQEQELVRLTRDYNVNDNIHKMLLHKLEEARIDESLKYTNESESYQIIDQAILPIHPAKPNRIKIILIGLILGLGAGLGLAYFLEYTDNSVKGYRDAKESFSLPLLGIISNIVTDKDIRREKHHNWYLLISGSFYMILIALIIVIDRIGVLPSSIEEIRLINWNELFDPLVKLIH